MPRLRFAGQITGCEGYVESAAIGLLAGRFAAAERLGEPFASPPPTTAFGAILGHITGGHLPSDDEPGKRSFQPMNVNFGLFPPIEVVRQPGVRISGLERGRGQEARDQPRAPSPTSTAGWPNGSRRSGRVAIRACPAAPRARASIAGVRARRRPGRAKRIESRGRSMRSR